MGRRRPRPGLLYLGATPLTHVQELFAVLGAYFAALADQFRLIVFDARGTGMSERDVHDVSGETLVLDSEAVIRAAHLDQFVALGDPGNLALSTALQLAVRLPEQVTHLALEAPFENIRELADTPYGRAGLALAEADWALYTQTLVRIMLPRPH